MELKQYIAVAVKGGKAQLQRVTENPKGNSTVEVLSQWKPLEFINMKALLDNVRIANAGQKVALAKCYYEFSKPVHFISRKDEGRAAARSVDLVLQAERANKGRGE